MCPPFALPVSSHNFFFVWFCLPFFCCTIVPQPCLQTTHLPWHFSFYFLLVEFCCSLLLLYHTFAGCHAFYTYLSLFTFLPFSLYVYILTTPTMPPCPFLSPFKQDLSHPIPTILFYYLFLPSIPPFSQNFKQEDKWFRTDHYGQPLTA